jgi:hypothetical protein
LPATYTETHTGESETANLKMQQALADFWKVMEENFNTDGEELPDSFWQKMFALAGSLTAVWESGMCPDFNLSTAGESR